MESGYYIETRKRSEDESTACTHNGPHDYSVAFEKYVLLDTRLGKDFIVRIIYIDVEIMNTNEDLI